ncbi:hypothetical protein N0V90_009569 [Kalmusia sp. IMI 367209]|nr:hypothetical protein N0V90_009569 [Kalmusia sp. IMI 367209]
MGLGVLEDHKLQHVPGTALLADMLGTQHQHQYHGRDTSALKHAKGRNADIVLVPQPSESPRDPLNWPQWKKELLLLIISIDTAVVGAWGPMISPGFATMAEQFNMSYNSLNGGLGWAIFAIGISCFVTNGLAVKFGRRPVIILGNLMLFVSSVWAYHAHSYESLLASRIFGAIGMSPFEVLTTAIIGDIYFVHERGLRLAFWGLCLSVGVGGGSCISGYIIENLGWNWTYGICACFYGVFILLIFFFVPETVYKRDPAYNLDLGTTDHTEEILDAKKAGEAKIVGEEPKDTLHQTERVVTVEPIYTGADEKPYTWLEQLLPVRGVESDENLLAIIFRPFGMLLFPQVFYGFITYGLSTSWLVVMGGVLAQIFTAPPYNFSVSAVGLVSISPLVASLLSFVAGPANDYTVKQLSRWNGGVYEPEFRLALNVITLVLGVTGFFGFGATLQNGAPWGGPVFLYGLIYFSMAFLNVGIYGYITECHRSKAPEAFAALNLRNVYSFGMNYFISSWISSMGPLQHASAMDRKALLVPCGLVLGSSYLATSIPTTFALDRPLHTVAVVLLLSGLAIVAYETRAAKTRRPNSATDRYVAIPLADGNGRPSSEEVWSSEERPLRRDGLGQHALAVLLAVLLGLLGARIAIFHAVIRHVECSGPTLTAFLPLVLALFHAFRPPKDRPLPAWSADSPPTTYLDRFVHFFLHGPTRYILPSFLLAISSFITTLRTSVLRSTYICPISTSAASLVPKLQLLGFLIDCIVVLILYRLVDEGISQSENNPPEPKDGTTVHGLIGFTFIASALLVGMVGIVVYGALPEHREWLLQAPREYLLGLLRLSLMIPLTMLCFLFSARMYGIMGAVLIAAFSSAFIGVLRALAMGVSYSFPPKSTAGISLCLTLLTIALILQLVADAIDSGQNRPKMPVRLGRNQTVSVVALLVFFSIGVGVYRYQKPALEHPITSLIAMAEEQHERWTFQAYQSKSLAQAVIRYQERYSRDPPPHFDKWYEFATNRDSIVIDDFDNIEEDLIPFSSLKPAELRKRTAEIIAHNQDLGGIRIRDGKVEAFGNSLADHKWMLDGIVRMIGKFVEFIPDMDLAFNLNDESRVAVPYEQFQAARMHHLHYPEHTAADGTIDFRLDRASAWAEDTGSPRTLSPFDQAGGKPSFQTYGSIACSPETRARKERRWDTSAFCSACAAPHSMGAFVADWTLSASPCHQPDLANLHGFHLSPAALSGTHNLVPIFSQSRAPGYADIRYPSPWNYVDKEKYEFGDKFPDPNFAKKENVLFWRGETTEGISTDGSWKGMLRQRFVHLLNNETSRQPIFLPTGSKNGKLEYVLEHPERIKELLETKVDARFVNDMARCSGPDCHNQKIEFWSGKPVDFRDHWRYRYLFDTDGAGFSGQFIPFLQSNSVVFKAALFREWYEGRLTAWKHFVPVDLRLHDLFSSLAYFGGYNLKEKGKRTIEPKDREAEAIARAGKVWTEKVLRKEDMEIYMFRLLLEWGRLTDDRRKDVGFRMDTKGRKGKEKEGKSEA